MPTPAYLLDSLHVDDEEEGHLLLFGRAEEEEGKKVVSHFRSGEKSPEGRGDVLFSVTDLLSRKKGQFVKVLEACLPACQPVWPCLAWPGLAWPRRREASSRERKNWSPKRTSPFCLQTLIFSTFLSLGYGPCGRY